MVLHPQTRRQPEHDATNGGCPMCGVVLGQYSQVERVYNMIICAHGRQSPYTGFGTGRCVKSGSLGLAFGPSSWPHMTCRDTEGLSGPGPVYIL